MEGWVKALVLFVIYIILVSAFDFLAVELIYSINENKINTSIQEFNKYFTVHKFIREQQNLIWFNFYQLLQGLNITLIALLNNKVDGNKIVLKQKQSLFIFFIGVLFATVILLILLLFQFLLSDVEHISISYSIRTQINYIILFFLVALIEELIFRGVFFSNLNCSLNKFNSLLISSILFAVIHVFNANFTIIGFTNLFLAGTLFCLFFITTKNIWSCIGFHFAWNYIQGPPFGFNISGLKIESLISLKVKNSIISGGEFGLEGSILCTLFFMLSIVCMLLVIRNKKENLYRYFFS